MSLPIVALALPWKAPEEQPAVPCWSCSALLCSLLIPHVLSSPSHATAPPQKGLQRGVLPCRMRWERFWEAGEGFKFAILVLQR